MGGYYIIICSPFSLFFSWVKKLFVVVVGFKADCLLVGPGPIGGMFSMGGFSKKLFGPGVLS